MATSQNGFQATTTKKTTPKKTSRAKVTKCPPAKAKGVKTQAEVPSPKRKSIAVKKATEATAKKASAKKAPSFSDSSVVVVNSTPTLPSRAAIAELIPAKGSTVSALVQKAVKAEVKPRGETTEEYVRHHIEGMLNNGKLALK